MKHYWTTLGSLLSVAEVGAWIEHAVQLPWEVAQLFVDASVSGYDFAELARDISEVGALKTEVGVRTQRQRNTLARAMRMRLTGVGRPPTSATPLVSLGAPKCTSVHLSWAVADGGGFPTHKYLLERRTKITSQHLGPRDMPQRHSILHSKYVDDGVWTIVADGFFHEFVDENLLPGVGYVYRVAAWNAIGRGNYAAAHFPVVARAPCDLLEYFGAWALLPIGKFVHACLLVCQYALTAFVLFFAILRLVDCGVRPEKYHPIFLTLSALYRLVLCYAPFVRDLLLLADVALSATTTSKKWHAAKLDVRPMGKLMPRLLNGPGLGNTLPPEMSISTHGALQNGRSDEYICGNLDTRGNKTNSTDSQSNHPSAICSGCLKPFLTVFRSRHYCYICATSFCKRCGVVRHSNMITCPVGSRCCCARCTQDQGQCKANADTRTISGSGRPSRAE